MKIGYFLTGFSGGVVTVAKNLARDNISTTYKFIQKPTYEKFNTCVCIVTHPLKLAGYVSLSNLASLIYDLVDKFYIVSGGISLEKLKKERNIWAFNVNQRISYNHFMKIINYLYIQIQIMRYIVEISKHVDYFLFFNGCTLIIPILVSKILNKKVITLLGGSYSQSSKYKGSALSYPLYIIEKISLSLSDQIILYSPNLIKKWNMIKYHHKISIAQEHFLNFKQFNIKKPLEKRDNLVGYIGRLSEEKGVLNFIKSIPKILNKRNEVKFILGGEGYLRTEIKEYLDKENLNEKVKLLDWIPHDELQNYLNELKLLIVPSYTEGGPIIMLEAMACGTPVLITQVGRVPDIIIEGEIGFLLKSNDSKHISDRTVEILDKPEILENVSNKGYKYVKENFSYENTLEIWQKIFSELVSIHCNQE